MFEMCPGVKSYSEYVRLVFHLCGIDTRPYGPYLEGLACNLGKPTLCVYTIDFPGAGHKTAAQLLGQVAHHSATIGNFMVSYQAT